MTAAAEASGAVGHAVADAEKLTTATLAKERAAPTGQGRHVDVNSERRAKKADKMARIIQRLIDPELGGVALDVGCGAGYIATRLRAMGWSTVALDIADFRTVQTPDFVLACAESLPFRSGTFSVIVSNLVIEHVGDPRAHLSEVRRVMAPGGLACVVAPNRLWPLEPHYKLPLLSWLPQPLADRYVRLVGRGTAFDASPLTRRRLLRLAAEAGLACRDITHLLVAETAEVEQSRVARLAGSMPDRLLNWLSWASPTFAFIMRRDTSKAL